MNPNTIKHEPLGPRASWVHRDRYASENNGFQGETWPETAHRVAREVLEPVFPDLVVPATEAITRREFLPGGRYFANAGRPFHPVNNCGLFRTEDSREGWARTSYETMVFTMMGGGVGVDYSAVRPEGAPVGRMGGKATGPLTPAQAVDMASMGLRNGGPRRSANYAALKWDHPDVLKWITAKELPEYVAEAKAEAWRRGRPDEVYARFESTNMSVRYDPAFLVAFNDEDHRLHAWAHRVWWTHVDHALRTGEPGWQYDADDWVLRNACTEVTSNMNGDVCNLGSIVLSRVNSRTHLAQLTEVGQAFLIAGSIYADIPDFSRPAVEAHRLTGLGIMGFADWNAVRGYGYAMTPELEGYLDEWRATSNWAARQYAARAGVAVPARKRAIAPNGTIGVLAGTTTGIEPHLAPAYAWRTGYGSREGDFTYEIIVDESFDRAVKLGADPDKIETAYMLAENPRRRLDFQAEVQKYVDHGISSTLNLPAHAEQKFTAKEFGEHMLAVLPSLRGATVYPDGAIGNQPMIPLDYETAVNTAGMKVSYEDVSNLKGCKSGSCGA